MFGDVFKLAVLSVALLGDPACAQALAPPVPVAAASDVASTELLHKLTEGLLALRHGGEAREQAVARDVDRAFRESAALSRAGQHANALARLEAVAQDRPLALFPSYRIQALAAVTQTQLGNGAAAALHGQAAQAMLTLLSGGRTPGRPIALLHLLLVDDLVMRAQAQRKPLQMLEQPGSGPLIVLAFENDPAGAKTRYLLPVPTSIFEPGKAASQTKP